MVYPDGRSLLVSDGIVRSNAPRFEPQPHLGALLCFHLGSGKLRLAPLRDHRPARGETTRHES